jgi:hypothetical protein
MPLMGQEKSQEVGYSLRMRLIIKRFSLKIDSLFGALERWQAFEYIIALEPMPSMRTESDAAELRPEQELNSRRFSDKSSSKF